MLFHSKIKLLALKHSPRPPGAEPGQAGAVFVKTPQIAPGSFWQKAENAAGRPCCLYKGGLVC